MLREHTFWCLGIRVWEYRSCSARFSPNRPRQKFLTLSFFVTVLAMAMIGERIRRCLAGRVWYGVGDVNVLVSNWLHSVGQNHFFVKMLLNRDSAIQSASRRFCTIYKSEKSDPLQSSGRRDILSGRPTVQSIIHLDERTFRLDLPLCQEASN